MAKWSQKNIEWHKANGTYTASYIIGAIIVTIGILVLRAFGLQHLDYLEAYSPLACR